MTQTSQAPVGLLADVPLGAPDAASESASNGSVLPPEAMACCRSSSCLCIAAAAITHSSENAHEPADLHHDLSDKI